MSVSGTIYCSLLLITACSTFIKKSLSAFSINLAISIRSVSSSLSTSIFTIDDITITEDDDPMKYFDNNPQKKALQKLGIQRMCCVRHFISQPNLINII